MILYLVHQFWNCVMIFKSLLHDFEIWFMKFVIWFMSFIKCSWYFEKFMGNGLMCNVHYPLVWDPHKGNGKRSTLHYPRIWERVIRTGYRGLAVISSIITSDVYTFCWNILKLQKMADGFWIWFMKFVIWFMSFKKCSWYFEKIPWFYDFRKWYMIF
jgi:hypothetical protein